MPQYDHAQSGPDALWSLLPVPILLLDVSGRITGANPAAETGFNLSLRRMLGACPDELIAFTPNVARVLTRVRDRAPTPNIATEAPSRATLSVFDLRAAVRDAHEMRCRLDICQIPEGWMLVFQSEDSLSTGGTGGPGSTTGPVRRADRAAIGMAELLAHEIKNPLAGISGAAQLLEMSSDTIDRELTGMIVDECQRVVRLLSQVEEFGNLLPPEQKTVNIHDVLDRAIRNAALGFASNVRLVREFDPSLPPTVGDADRLVQVFLNLLKNAAEAFGRGGAVPSDAAPEIRLRTFYESGLHRRAGDGHLAGLPLQIEVCDNGPGLPPDIADQVFEAFVSGRENGSGLGLALVNRILAAHGGMVRVDSAPGRTVFRISLPISGAEHNIKNDQQHTEIKQETRAKNVESPVKTPGET